MTPRVDVLPMAQRRLWTEFTRTLPSIFVPYGGTALALRTGSRQSEDFDFFSNAPIDAHTLSDTVPFLREARLIHAAPSTATFLVNRGGPIKVSFFGALRVGRVDDVSVCTDTGVALASRSISPRRRHESFRCEPSARTISTLEP